MDFQRILNFSDYKPLMDEDPQSIIDEIIIKINKYSGEDYSEIIQRTYDFTKSAHEWIYRLSGEAYITHPVQVAQILMDLKPDIASIQTAILHDVIEDTEYTFEDISKLFWEEVAILCEWLVKVKKVRYKWEDAQVETIKKTFLAMAQDLRVILIKIADRIHNMQTLVFHPSIEKQEKIALETMKIYVPVCKRLGLYQYQTLLENLCFRILDPESFTKVFKHFKRHVPVNKKDASKWIELITQLLEKEGLKNFTVKGRLKSPYRVYEKMTKKYQTWDFNKVLDLLAFRIITDNVSDCYTVLWIIHKHYTPLINKIKDYIAIPKFNGYKSIHTTIVGLFRLPTELQIRTKEMDQVAEYWVAAHFAYSDNNQPIIVNKKQSQWISNLQELVKNYTNRDESTTHKKEEFKKKLNIDILNKSNFLYTPKWDIIEIPRWWTVLDFAFYIHSDVGLRFKHAIVNGNIVPINYCPKTGDIVDIKIFRNKYTATRHWMEFANSPSSKSKIARFIRQEEKEWLIEKVKNLVNKQLHIMKLPPFGSKEDKINKIIDTKEIEKKLLEIWDKKSTITQFIKIGYPEEIAHYNKNKHKKELGTTKTIAHEQDTSEQKQISQKNTEVIIDNNQFVNYSLCPECTPKDKDIIIAKVDKNGIKIHTISCIAMKTINFDKLLEAHWKEKEETNYNLDIVFKLQNRMKPMVLLKEIYLMNIEITKFSIIKNKDNQDMHISINSKNPTKIQYLINGLKKFKNSIKIVRKSIN